MSLSEMYPGPLQPPGFLTVEVTGAPCSGEGLVRTAFDIAVQSTAATPTESVVGDTPSWTASTPPPVLRWSRFVASQLEREIGSELFERVRRFSAEFVEPLGEQPSASATDEGSYLMNWLFGDHHLEAEIYPDGTYDWFFLDHSTGCVQSQEGVSVGDYDGLRRQFLTSRR